VSVADEYDDDVVRPGEGQADGHTDGQTDDQTGAVLSDQEPETLSSTQLAERIGVTAQTIRNWAARGMPTAGTDGRGGLRFEEARARAWARANLGPNSHGGRRPGAGRKRRRSAWRDDLGLERAELRQSDRARRAAQARERLERLREEAAAGATPEADALELATDLCRLTDADLRLLAHLAPELTGLSPAGMGRLDKLLAAQKRLMELDRERGRLIAADEAARAWAEALRPVRERLDDLPERLADQLARELDLGHDRRRVAAEAAERCLREVRDALASGECTQGDTGDTHG